MRPTAASAERRRKLSTTRSVLVHGHPVDARRQSERASCAWTDLDALLAATALLITSVRSKDLLA